MSTDDTEAQQQDEDPLERSRLARQRLEAIERHATAERIAGEQRAELEWKSALDSLKARAEQAMVAAQLLPCYPAMVLQPPAVEVAVGACHAAGARAGCEKWTRRDPTCARLIATAQLEAIADRLHEARIPGAIDAGGSNRLRRLLRDGWMPWPTVEARKLAEPMLAELLLATCSGFFAPGGAPIAPLPLDALEPLEAVRAFTARQPGPEWALVMGGAIGIGKTVAASSLALERSVLFVAAPELVKHDPEVTPRRAALAAVLILDDLGTERDAASEYAVDTLVELLTERQRHRRLTIITTNLRRWREGNADGLRERYGERLFDRLREGATMVGFRGESQRGAR